jgi:hypothetical protein
LHPALHVRDDRERPSCEAGRRRLVEMICPTGKVEYFFNQDWTGKIRLKGFSKFDFTRQLSKLDVSPDVICRTTYRLH